MTAQRLLVTVGVLLALAGIGFMAWRSRFAVDEDGEPAEVL